MTQTTREEVLASDSDKPKNAIDWASGFDDLQIGDAFATRGRTVTESDVVAFAGLSGDFHPLHTDAEWAEKGPFGERIAHGMLTLSIASGLVPFDPARIVALRRIADVTFRRPVKFGDTIHLEGKIVELDSVDDTLGRVTLAWSIINQDSVSVCRAKVQVLWRRDEG